MSFLIFKDYVSRRKMVLRREKKKKELLKITNKDMLELNP